MTCFRFCLFVCLFIFYLSLSLSSLPLLPLATQEDIFRHEYLTRFDPESVLRTLWAMIELCDAEQSVLDTIILNEDEQEEEESNYPDIVPRESSKTVLTTTTTTTKAARTRSTDLETIFLLSIFFGTIILLYVFPPADP